MDKSRDLSSVSKFARKIVFFLFLILYEKKLLHTNLSV